MKTTSWQLQWQLSRPRTSRKAHQHQRSVHSRYSQTDSGDPHPLVSQQHQRHSCGSSHHSHRDLLPMKLSCLQMRKPAPWHFKTKTSRKAGKACLPSRHLFPGHGNAPLPSSGHLWILRTLLNAQSSLCAAATVLRGHQVLPTMRRLVLLQLSWLLGLAVGTHPLHPNHRLRL